MNRRELLKLVAAACGGTITPGVVRALGQERDTASTVLSAEELELVTALAEGILPRTATSPGATDAGVAAFVDTIVAGYLPEAAAASFRRVLSALIAEEPVDVHRLLTRLDSATFGGKASSTDEKAFYRTLKELTVAGYFTSKVGQTQALAQLRPYGPFEADYEIDADTKAWS